MVYFRPPWLEGKLWYDFIFMAVLIIIIKITNPVWPQMFLVVSIEELNLSETNINLFPLWEFLPIKEIQKNICINIDKKILYIYIYHHHHIALVARISLTLSRHSSLSFIALGRSSGQHPVSSHSCWMYVRAGRSAFARPCVGIHKSTSLISSSLSNSR